MSGPGPVIGRRPGEQNSDWSRPVSTGRGHTSGTGSKVGCSETICTEGPDRQITFYKTLYNLSFDDLNNITAIIINYNYNK